MLRLFNTSLGFFALLWFTYLFDSGPTRRPPWTAPFDAHLETMPLVPLMLGRFALAVWWPAICLAALLRLLGAHTRDDAVPRAVASALALTLMWLFSFWFGAITPEGRGGTMNASWKVIGALLLVVLLHVVVAAAVVAVCVETAFILRSIRAAEKPRLRAGSAVLQYAAAIGVLMLVPALIARSGLFTPS